MSETPTEKNPFASVTWPESYPDACQSADNHPPAVTTLPDATLAENGVSGANMDTMMRRCNTADDEAPATGTEAQVCRDIAKRQRRGLAKYGKTVIGNNLSFAQWLQHFYEELLDGAVYAKRILTTMAHEPENQKQHQDDAGAPGVLHRHPAPHHGIPEPVPIRTPAGAGNDSDFCPGPVARHRKPGAGRKPKPCPNCGAVKSIGSTVKAGIPTRRCKTCGFVVQTYPHLANAAKAPA